MPNKAGLSTPERLEDDRPKQRMIVRVVRTIFIFSSSRT
jgi:hypothetical protein